MKVKNNDCKRRDFLKTIVASIPVAAGLPSKLSAEAFHGDSLQVWSCGGLSEAFTIINKKYEKRTGVKIHYTGAFAGALGKSLLGNAVTEVFAGRVLKLAKDLRAANKMLYFKPLCFTEYVIITPKGNPAGIKSLEDLTKPGIPIILPLGASPPGGSSIMAILKNANIAKQVLGNTVKKETCVIKMMPEIVTGRGKASIVERRLTRIPNFEGKVEVIPIPEEYFPPGPLAFTIGVMKYAKDRELADSYVDYLCSEEGQSVFERQGFIPAISEKGKMLIEKLGVKDA